MGKLAISMAMLQCSSIFHSYGYVKLPEATAKAPGLTRVQPSAPIWAQMKHIGCLVGAKLLEINQDW